MALDAALLEQQLLDKVIQGLTVTPGSTVVQQFMAAGDHLADAYATYAKAAMSCGGFINTGLFFPQQQAMAASLASAMQTAVDPASAAGAIVTALGVLWANPLVWTPIPPALPATLVVPVGAPVLQAGLITQAGINAAAFPAGSPEQAAQQLAALLDAYTKLVTVTHALPAPPFVCVAPIF
jgi:hypothetical protein